MADNDNEEIQNPTKAQEWLDLIDESKAYFRDYLDSCDNIDKLYSDLEQYRSGNNDRDFALFWSNIQVMGPSIYARPPQPVVTPKFKDRRPVYRTASEMLERVSSVAFDQADINQVMLLCRDDLTINGRGVSWVRYEENKVCIEHLDRRDFLHEPARKWADVSWVARRGWLCYEEMEERFGVDVAEEVSYQTKDRDNKFGPQDNSKKCGVWEIWHKGQNKVVWVTEGVEDVLEIDDPHLKLEGFFPCPQPAYATVQRRTLIPVADVVYYKGQLEQINIATARIHALSNALSVKGFYQGGGETGDAIEAAMNAEDDGRVFVPISSMAAFGSGSGDPVWMWPIDQVATTMSALVEFRRQIIDDVYQIIGLSDIMRGATEASETATAQQIKQQNGSYRVRDKQNELVRLARDLVRISAEIIAEEYDRKTLEEMAQMDIPHKKDIDAQLRDVKAQLDGLNAEIERASSDPEIQAMMQQNPEAGQQAMQQARQQLQALQGQAKELEDTVTMEKVLDFLRDNKLRPFVLDIETDSTIYPDEMQEKASRAEFMQVFMGTMPAVAQLAALGPQALALAGGVLKFALAPYRVGRELDGLVDDFVDSAPQIAQQMQAQQGEGQGEDMAALAEAEMEKARVAGQKVQLDSQKAQMDLQQKQMSMEADFAERQAKLQQEQEKIAQKGQELAMKYEELQAKIDNIRADTMKKIAEAGVAVDSQALDEFKSLSDIELRKSEIALNQANRAEDMAVAERDKQVDTTLRVRDSERAALMGDRQQTLAERQAERGK